MELSDMNVVNTIPKRHSEDNAYQTDLQAKKHNNKKIKIVILEDQVQTYSIFSQIRAISQQPTNLKRAPRITISPNKLQTKKDAPIYFQCKKITRQINNQQFNLSDSGYCSNRLLLKYDLMIYNINPQLKKQSIFKSIIKPLQTQPKSRASNHTCYIISIKQKTFKITNFVKKLKSILSENKNAFFIICQYEDFSKIQNLQQLNSKKDLQITKLILEQDIKFFKLVQKDKPQQQKNIQQLLNLIINSHEKGQFPKLPRSLQLSSISLPQEKTIKQALSESFFLKTDIHNMNNVSSKFIYYDHLNLKLKTLKLFQNPDIKLNFIKNKLIQSFEALQQKRLLSNSQSFLNNSNLNQQVQNFNLCTCGFKRKISQKVIEFNRSSGSKEKNNKLKKSNQKKRDDLPNKLKIKFLNYQEDKSSTSFLQQKSKFSQLSYRLLHKQKHPQELKNQLQIQQKFLNFGFPNSSLQNRTQPQIQMQRQVSPSQRLTSIERSQNLKLSSQSYLNIKQSQSPKGIKNENYFKSKDKNQQNQQENQLIINIEQENKRICMQNDDQNENENEENIYNNHNKDKDQQNICSIAPQILPLLSQIDQQIKQFIQELQIRLKQNKNQIHSMFEALLINTYKNLIVPTQIFSQNQKINVVKNHQQINQKRQENDKKLIINQNKLKLNVNNDSNISYEKKQEILKTQNFTNKYQQNQIREEQQKQIENNLNENDKDEVNKVVLRQGSLSFLSVQSQHDAFQQIFAQVTMENLLKFCQQIVKHPLRRNGSLSMQEFQKKLENKIKQQKIKINDSNNQNESMYRRKTTLN